MLKLKKGADFGGSRAANVGNPTTAGDGINLSSAGRDALSLSDYSKLMPWFAALANRRNATANVVCIGASLTEGYPVTSFDRTWPQYLAENLRANLPTKGLTGGGRGFVAIPHTVMNGTGGSPWTITGGTQDNGSFDLGASHKCWYVNFGTNKVVLTLANPVTSFDIRHVVSTSGGATAGYYKIDGGTAVVFSTSAGAQAETVLHVASAATSTIEIGWNATGYIIVNGVSEYNGDESKGIQVHDCGHSGRSVNLWNQNATPTGSWRASVAALNPHLLILSDLGINDASPTGANRSAAQFQTDLTTFIATLRAGSITCPILLTAVYDVSSANAMVSTWAEYVAAMKAVADADSTVAFLNLNARMPATNAASTYSLYHTDSVHGSATGVAYQFMADTIATAILPR